MTPENAVVADHHRRGSPRSAARTRIAHVARAHGKKSVHLHDNLSPLAKLRVCCACPAREGRFMRRLEAEQQLPRRGRKPMPKQLTVMGAIPCRSMRRLRVVPRKHTSGRLGSPSAATMSGCHAMAGRGCDEGGEIRRMKRACGSYRIPEARSLRPKSPRVARRKATRFVFTLARWRRNATPTHVAPRGAPLPSPSEGRNCQHQLARRRGNDYSWLFEMWIRIDGKSSSR